MFSRFSAETREKSIFPKDDQKILSTIPIKPMEPMFPRLKGSTMPPTLPVPPMPAIPPCRSPDMTTTTLKDLD